jgi:hypothetical protein
MKKIIFVIFTCFNCILYIFPEQRIVIEELNLYGGNTIEHSFNEQEQIATNYFKLIEYYDFQNQLIKMHVIPVDTVINSSGVEEQVQYYKDGVIWAYEMGFNSEYENIHGYDRLIEEVDSNDVIVKRTYYNDNIILNVSEDREEKFQFYDIDFIDDEFFEDYVQNSRGDIRTMSAKYFAIKSFIKFDSQLVNLDERDIMMMQYFSTSFNVTNFEQYYAKKVKVYSEKKSYWLYVQKSLEEYVLGQYATIKYYPIGRNKELYLICIGFDDVFIK